MSEIIEPGDQCDVRDESSFADEQTKTLMSGDLFAVFDRRGDFRTIVPENSGPGNVAFFSLNIGLAEQLLPTH